LSTRSAAAAAAALALLTLLATPAAGESYDVKAYVWIRLTVANNSTLSHPLPPLTVELPVNDTYQFSRLLNATVRVAGAPAPCRVVITRGECGSAYLRALCDAQLPPRGTAELEAVSEVLVRRFRAPLLDVAASGTLRDIPRELAEFTRAEGPWPYDSPRARYLVDAAKRVAGGEERVLAVAFKLVSWIWSKVDYEVGRGPRYPWETLPPPALEAGRGRGDCDDQANLLILMLRSLGIPAYLKTALIADFNYREERRIWAPEARYYAAFVGIDYAHAWAEVYVPPWGWLPVDLTFNAGRDDPANAISTSAPSERWAWYTIVTIRMESVCHRDYIREFREWAAQASATPLFYYWEYAVVKEGDSIARVKGFLRPLPLPWVRPTRLEVKYPSKTRALSEVVIEGRLEPGIANATVLVRATKPSGGELLLEATTGPSGEWSLHLTPDEAGAWSFNATFPGSPDYTGCSREFTIYVEKIPSSLTLKAEHADGCIEVEGRLDPPLNASLTLIVTTPFGRTIVTEVKAVGGSFAWSFPANEPGEYAVRAYWAGNEVYEHASSSALALVELPTELAVSARLEGGRVVVEGALKPPLPNVTVEIEAVSGGRKVEALAVTGANGTFRAELALEAGEWEVRATFSGSGGYKPSSSAVKVSVPRAYPAEALALVLAAAVAGALLLYRFKRGATRGAPAQEAEGGSAASKPPAKLSSTRGP